MLRRNEEDGASSLYPLTKLRPCGRRILITILDVNRQVSDFDDAELQTGGASSASALAAFRSIDSCLKLSTMTATSRILFIWLSSLIRLNPGALCRPNRLARLEYTGVVQ
jgi:hypothetical protein